MISTILEISYDFLFAYYSWNAKNNALFHFRKHANRIVVAFALFDLGGITKKIFRVIVKFLCAPDAKSVNVSK